MQLFLQTKEDPAADAGGGLTPRACLHATCRPTLDIGAAVVTGNPLKAAEHDLGELSMAVGSVVPTALNAYNAARHNPLQVDVHGRDSVKLWPHVGGLLNEDLFRNLQLL